MAPGLFAAPVGEEVEDLPVRGAGLGLHYVKTARQMMTHGGIGFTWEHDAHLCYRNAVSAGVLLGDVAFQRRRLARLLAV